MTNNLKQTGYEELALAIVEDVLGYKYREFSIKDKARLARVEKDLEPFLRRLAENEKRIAELFSLLQETEIHLRGHGFALAGGLKNEVHETMADKIADAIGAAKDKE